MSQAASFPCAVRAVVCPCCGRSQPISPPLTVASQAALDRFVQAAQRTWFDTYEALGRCDHPTTETT